MNLHPFFYLLIFIYACSGKNDQPVESNSSDSAASSNNPVISGHYADPEVTRFGDSVWIFPTYSDVYDRQVFMDAFSSADLVNWTKHSRIIDTARIAWADSAMWAPAAVQKDDRYYLFFGANDVHPGQTGGIGVAVAEQLKGPYRDLLGKPLIGTIENGAQPIDQFVFRDNDSTWLMYYGGWGHCNVVRLNDDFTGLIPFEDGTMFREVTPEDYVEGPFMFKRNGKYYFMWSEGGWTGPDYRVAYAISDSPYGPFKREGIILKQNPEIATGAGHHSVLYLEENDSYYMVYHRRPLGKTDRNARVVCIDRMEFDQEGKILPVTITHEGVAPVKLN